MHPVDNNCILEVAMLEDMGLGWFPQSDLAAESTIPTEIPPFPRLTLGGLRLTFCKSTI
jgi:hypothetical protein